MDTDANITAGLAAEVRQALQAAGGNLRAAARLVAVAADRRVLLEQRRTAFLGELASLMPLYDSTVEEVFSPEELQALLTKHGLTVSPDGQPALAKTADRPASP